MWAESSPKGSLVWTSSGDDLLAYRSSEASAANAAPRGPALRSARRLAGAVPPTGVTGAVFWHRRLLLAGERNGTYEVWAVDLRNGERRLELKMSICGESEGLDVIRTLGGELHWLIGPYDPGCELTFGPSSALLHFVPRRGDNRLVVKVLRLEATEVPGNVVALVRVTSHSRPLSGARVSFAGAKAWTNRHGRANVSATLQLPGRFRALARKEGHYGLSDLVPVGVTSTAQRAPVPRSGAR
jgi:hypothetical protein